MQYTQQNILRMKNGIEKFAWYPTKIISEHSLKGHVWIWLQKYIEFYSVGKTSDGVLFLWSASGRDHIPISDKYLSKEDATFYRLKKEQHAWSGRRC